MAKRRNAKAKRLRSKRNVTRQLALPAATACVSGTDDEYLNEGQVTAEFPLGVRWLQKKRQEGSAGTGDAGPPFYKVGDNVRYRRGDVKAYMASRKVDRSKNALQPPQPAAAT